MLVFRHITVSGTPSAAFRTVSRCFVLCVVLCGIWLTSCVREPMLHLHQEDGYIDYELPEIEFELDVFWDYELDYGVSYNWREEWFYGDDPGLFDYIGYTKPTRFELRRYYTGEEPNAPHTQREEYYIDGYTFRERFAWGYWDLLVWNQIIDYGDGQALQMEEYMDSVVFHTPQTPYSTRHTRGTTRFTRSFYQPEELFSAYNRAEHISSDLEGFIYDPNRHVYVRRDSLDLHPATYIYLTQVILHNNRGRVIQVDGNANLSGMARSVNIATGRAGSDPITTYYNVGMKKDITIQRKTRDYTENVDIIGGRLLTFGMCGIDGSRVAMPKRGKIYTPDGETMGRTDSGHRLYSKDNMTHIDDGNHHYMDVTMHFSTGGDSTFVFDVTDQVRRRWKGGVLTVELDMDTISIPSRDGGSGFDADVEDYEDVDAYPEDGWEI